MDDKTKADIDAGVPMVIIHWDENGTTTSQEAYNLENISLSDWQKEQLARATLEACRKFYIGTIHVAWDCGFSLGIAYRVDHIKKL